MGISLWSLMRHKAQCNLNSDEVQNHFSQCVKPLNAMSLDQFHTVFPAIDQPLSSLTSSSCSTTNNNATPLIGNYNNHKDDVWRGGAVAETTLQELLIPPGANHLETTQSNGNNIVGDSQSMLSNGTAVMQQQHAEWWQYQQEQKQHISLMNSNVSSPYVNTIVGPGYPENHQLGMQPLSLAMPKRTLSDSQITVVETKQSDECIDKSIQRKQKRKIKNRESAARSRARKQAYINQLEEEVTKLTNKNKKLKKQKEDDMATRSLEHISRPKYQLRRTSSALF